MRSLLLNTEFSISVLLAVAISCLFAFVLEATFEVVASMLVTGVVTAIAEYVMRNRNRLP